MKRKNYKNKKLDPKVKKFIDNFISYVIRSGRTIEGINDEYVLEDYVIDKAYSYEALSYIYKNLNNDEFYKYLATSKAMKKSIKNITKNFIYNIKYAVEYVKNNEKMVREEEEHELKLEEENKKKQQEKEKLKIEKQIFEEGLSAYQKKKIKQLYNSKF